MPRSSLSLLMVLTLGAPLLAPPSPAVAAPPVVNAPYLPGFNSSAPPAAPPPAGETGAGAALTSPTPPGLAPGAELAAPTEPMPANPTTASEYMAIAAQAVAQQQAEPALRALGRAETRLISRSVPLFQTHSPADDPAVRLIEQARAAVRAGDFATAATVIQRATPVVAQEENAPPPNPPVGLPTAPAPR